MTHKEIKNEMDFVTRNEREFTKRLLILLCKAEAMETYLFYGKPSLFACLTENYKYANAAADRRIRAARLLKCVPQAQEQIRDGSLNLSTMAKANSILNRAEKAGTQISLEDKANALNAIVNKTEDEAERILYQHYSEAAAPVTKAKSRRMKNGTTRCPLDFTDAQMKDLKRLREVLSHTLPGATDAELIAYLMTNFLKKKDPLTTSGAEVKRPSRAQTRRLVRQNANDACTFKDPLTGQVCGSRHQTQLDHIKPKALGGDDSPENLRVVCRRHNILLAERTFGKAHMDRFRR